MGPGTPIVTHRRNDAPDASWSRPSSVHLKTPHRVPASPQNAPCKRTAWESGIFRFRKTFRRRPFFRGPRLAESLGCQVRSAGPWRGVNPWGPVFPAANGPVLPTPATPTPETAETVLMDRRPAKPAGITEVSAACSAKGPPRSRDEASHRQPANPVRTEIRSRASRPPPLDEDDTEVSLPFRGTTALQITREKSRKITLFIEELVGLTLSRAGT